MPKRELKPKSPLTDQALFEKRVAYGLYRAFGRQRAAASISAIAGALGRGDKEGALEQAVLDFNAPATKKVFEKLVAELARLFVKGYKTETKRKETA